MADYTTSNDSSWYQSIEKIFILLDRAVFEVHEFFDTKAAFPLLWLLVRYLASVDFTKLNLVFQLKENPIPFVNLSRLLSFIVNLLVIIIENRPPVRECRVMAGATEKVQTPPHYPEWHRRYFWRILLDIKPVGCNSFSLPHLHFHRKNSFFVFVLGTTYCYDPLHALETSSFHNPTNSADRSF